MPDSPRILSNIPKVRGLSREALPYEPVCALFRRYLHEQKLKFTPERAMILDAALGHIRLMAQPPVYLKKETSGWKVDLAAMRQYPHHSPQSIEQYLAAGKALTAAARDVRSGRYKTLDDAQQALGEQPGR